MTATAGFRAHVIARRLVAALAATVATGLLCVSAACAAGPASESELRDAIAAQMAHAGPAAGAYVVDLSNGRVVFDDRSAVRRVPASLEKLYTTTTALLRLGPRARLSTRVLGVGRRDGATWRGDLYLRGAGDFTFGSAYFVRHAYGTGSTVESLAASLRRSGIRRVTGSTLADATLFSDNGGVEFGLLLCRHPLFGADCPYGPVSGFQRPMPNGPRTPVAFNRGLQNATSARPQREPVLRSARELARALRRSGIRVAGGAGSGRTPPNARVLATVRSPDVARLALMTNHPSDNYAAETLFRVLGARFSGSGSRAGGESVVTRELARRFRLHPTVYNGSGESPRNRTSPRQVVALLTAMQRRPERHAFVRSLSIVGRTGTFATHDRGTVAEGRCFVKDGTLTAPVTVANVAGYCDSVGGKRFAFAVMTNGMPVKFMPPDEIVSPVFPLEDKILDTLAGYRE
jgi:D-alanyl-D-alanine carboxypeptidase/D-alanyl-D-alanine-endopeptidase (penicillin-binding protein 4)